MNEKIRSNTLNVLLSMGSAIRNLRLYPANSVIVNDAMEKLQAALLNYFEIQKSLTLSEADQKLLIGGEALSYQDHEKPQITSLLEILLKFNLKSVTFRQGVEKRELLALLDYFAKNPEGRENASGLSKIIAEKKLSHIGLDERVFVARRKHGQGLDSLDMTDEDIIELLGLAHLESLKKNRQTLTDMARNPELLLEPFNAGVSQLLAEKETFSRLQLSEKLIKMMTLMDKAAHSLDRSGQTKILQGMESSIARIDPDVAWQIMSQNTVENLFAGMLSQYIAAEFGKRASTRLEPLVVGDLDQERAMDNAAPEPASGESQDLRSGKEMETPSGDGKKHLLDKASIDDLLNIAEKLVTLKGQKDIEATIYRLMENMFADEARVSDEAAGAMVEIIESLFDRKKIEFVEKISDQLLAWIRLQTAVTPVYRKISGLLGDLVHDFIRQGNLAGAVSILDVFHHLRMDSLDKDEPIHEEAVGFINALTIKEHLDALFVFFNGGDPKKRGKAGDILMMLGDDAQNRMLDLLRDQTNSDERVRIMRLVIDSGRRALPFIHDRIRQDESWYYLRNMAYILGSIGDDASARILQPLLLHENHKVRTEALKSIVRIGGKEMCPLLFSILPRTDHKFMLNIMDALAGKKCTDAITGLIDLFEAGSIKDKSLRTDVEEKICNVLGSLGSPEAIPFLSRIAESKSFLGLSRYSEKVKIAAGKALAAITNRS